MQRTFGLAATLAALGFAGALGMGAPATAAQTSDVGTQALRSLRVYEHDDFGGRSAHLTANDSNFNNNRWNTNTTATIDDNISSIKNQGDMWAYLYPSPNHGGTPYRAQPTSQDKDLSSNSNNPSNFDNKASSVKFLS
ncbi:MULTISPECIES: peptidase inhibitor family I36 protein [Nocardiopsidaceae]|uniref:Peptidase inhibitor family I36 protein n=1 Tax=Streptomonospora nanhaiensis TaxID=1323731 RepID=A0ABY6YGD6_9ACTN|nr:peptidase inhibitor family I36 protein [Streptomonospora nanhaiensis]WAE71307.1 peptidase inhibitor family I36 protein [Streptomonospora nanhaiensis]